MYVNPFWFGVICTLLVEFVVLIVYSAIAINDEDGDE